MIARVMIQLRIVLLAVLAVAPLAARGDPGLVTVDELTSLGRAGYAADGFEMPVMSPALPLIDPKDTSPEATLLRRLENAGKASGFEGVIYDNRDRGHSLLPEGTFPRLATLQYGLQLLEHQADYGLAGKILLPAIVIGNSSTAITRGKINRSQPRLAMSSSTGSLRAFLTYASNHLYIYPEHKDHDGVDRFPANWPYMVISQGSSRSDKPFLRALLMTVAALPSETRDKLRDEKLIAPTLQMILRRSQAGVYSRDDYMTGRANPVVFDKKNLAPERMVSLAAALKPDEIPPVVKLSVAEEDFQAHAGLAGLSEELFTTPSAIARLWRGPEYSRRMVVSAEETEDPNGHRLRFYWVLLQGDPERVRIRPKGQGDTSAEITVDWHDTYRPLGAKQRTTDRVDIGVFAWNGAHYSAPAIISIGFPGYQTRQYEPIPNGPGKRLISVDYDAEGRETYYDPLLYWTAPWMDRISYDATGAIAEITRQTPEETLNLSAPDRLRDGRNVSYLPEDTKQGRYLRMTIEPDE